MSGRAAAGTANCLARTRFRNTITVTCTTGFHAPASCGFNCTPGTWKIIRIDYDLQANTPKGNWFAVLDGTQLGAPVTQL